MSKLEADGLEAILGKLDHRGSQLDTTTTLFFLRSHTTQGWHFSFVENVGMSFLVVQFEEILKDTSNYSVFQKLMRSVKSL